MRSKFFIVSLTEIILQSANRIESNLLSYLHMLSWSDNEIERLTLKNENDSASEIESSKFWTLC